MATWSRQTYSDGTSYSTKSPSGATVYIEKSLNAPAFWTAGGRLYQYLADAKADVIQRIEAGEEFSAGGLLTKKYVNPVKVTDNRKKKT
jgi:hypothetical protein